MATQNKQEKGGELDRGTQKFVLVEHKGRRYRLEGRQRAEKTRPIRNTSIEFHSEAELVKFLNYATQRKRTRSKVLDKVREDLQTHTRIQHKG